MALRIVEFFGYTPLDPAARPFINGKKCPFVNGPCIKPDHGACSLEQATSPEPIICCPNRMYADNYQMLQDIANEIFGIEAQLVKPEEITSGEDIKTQVVVFGKNWGHELPLPRPPGGSGGESRKYYIDWILTKLDAHGEVLELTAIEVQTIDTTGNYNEQVSSFFSGNPFKDSKGRIPGFSRDAGMNWENVNKRILSQIIYKGHVLRREAKCRKGLFFVCPKPVYDRIIDRLGGRLHEYQPGNGTITFRSYTLGPKPSSGNLRSLKRAGEFTTTIDQVALTFTAPMNLPGQNVYEAAIKAAIAR